MKIIPQGATEELTVDVSAPQSQEMVAERGPGCTAGTRASHVREWTCPLQRGNRGGGVLHTTGHFSESRRTRPSCATCLSRKCSRHTGTSARKPTTSHLQEAVHPRADPAWCFGRGLWAGVGGGGQWAPTPSGRFPEWCASSEHSVKFRVLCDRERAFDDRLVAWRDR